MLGSTIFCHRRCEAESWFVIIAGDESSRPFSAAFTSDAPGLRIHSQQVRSQPMGDWTVDAIKS